MSMHRRTLIGAAAAVGFAAMAAAATSGIAAAQEAFPSKVIKFVVPYSAGGGQDRWARVVASSAIDHLGQAMHVQVRPGAGGTVGWRYLLDQPADGHTIMIGSLSPMIAVLTEPNAPMGINDVRIIANLSDFNPHMMVLPGSEVDSWEKMVAYAEANPGALTVGGTLAQAMGAANVFSQAELDVTIVPYPGTSAAVTDMLGGHIDVAVVTPATVVSLGDQAVPVLNVGGRPNSEAFVEEVGRAVPWAGDFGFDGLLQPRWIGVHPETPPERIQALSDGIKAILEDKSVQRLISNLGEEIFFAGTEEAQASYDSIVSVLEGNVSLLQ